MEIISSSTAYLGGRSILTQHQSVLILIQGVVDDPDLAEYRWLDLACGRGQLILQLQQNLGENLRSKICYHGYDGQNEYLAETEKRANSLGFKSIQMRLGNLSDFPVIIPHHEHFDLITFTNTVHELAPLMLPIIIFESILRLAPTGQLFLYDMEYLPISDLELGAVTWRQTEIQKILANFFDQLKVPRYVPTAGQWGHSTCNGWNVQIRRSYISSTNDQLASNKDQAIQTTQALMKDIIAHKLRDCMNALESLTKYGAENPSEGGETNRLLYDLWALTRAAEAVK